jgi:hypothetical protein
MTQNDILILAKAGFTAQQIAALSVTQAPATPAASAAPATPAASAAPAAPTTQAAPAALAAQAPLTYEQFQQELQKMALMGAQQSGKAETADTILASIINPPTTNIEEGNKWL